MEKETLKQPAENELPDKNLEQAYEYGLPEYLQSDLDAYKKGVQEQSSLLDCLWGELYSSINIAEITDAVISAEHANYLRQKYLYGGQE